jgi:hypothetical protein
MSAMSGCQQLEEPVKMRAHRLKQQESGQLGWGAEMTG